MSKGVLFGGIGGVGIAVAATVFIITKGGGGANPPVNTPAPAPTSAETTAKAITDPTTPPVTNPGTSGTQKQPDPAPLNRPGGTTPPAGSTTNPVVTNPPVTNPPVVAPMTRLQEWFQELNREGVPDARATAIIGEVELLRPNLTGLTLAEAHFVEMTAYLLLENETGSCRAAREVKRLHTTASRIEQADRVLTNFCS